MRTVQPSRVCAGPSSRALARAGAILGALAVAGSALGDWPTVAVCWPEDGLPLTGFGKYTGIAVEPGGKAWISHYIYASAWKDLGLGRAKVWPSGLVQASTVLGEVSSSNIGEFSDIALDVEGRLHICYYNRNSKKLMYLRRDYPEAEFPVDVSETIAFAVYADLGQFASIALDSAGRPHVSYYAASGKVLRHAVRTGSNTWTNETVPSAAAAGSDVGKYTSIAIDAGDVVHISYIDDTADDLRYARKVGSTWTDTAVDTGATVNQQTAIGQRNGVVYIAYYDGSGGGRLKLATRTSSGWTSAMVHDPVSGNVGKFASLAVGYKLVPIGPLGAQMEVPVLHVSYYDQTNGNLLYVRRVGAGLWEFETVDSTADVVGQHTSIGLDGAGGAHISYFDVTNGRLKYARNW